MNAIEVNKLTKDFNGFRAVDGIGLEVKSGEIFGLLGPNGAGKTTTIRMLATMTKPTAGEARVCGLDVTKEPDAVRRCIGIVFQDPALDDQLTGRENLDFHARMYGMPREERNKRITEVLKLVELEDRAGELTEKYSGGMRRRLEIARGLMHMPKVLFLDEPTIGLDAQTRRVIWDHIIKLNKAEKVTIILTTHYMEEADVLCGRVAIMDHGKILAIDTPANLKSSIGGDVIILKTKESKKMAEIAAKIKGVVRTKVHDGSVSLSLKDAGGRILSIIKAAENAGITIESVDLHKPTLEDVFIHYTGKTIRDQDAGAGDAFRRHAQVWRRR